MLWKVFAAGERGYVKLQFGVFMYVCVYELITECLMYVGIYNYASILCVYIVDDWESEMQ